MKRLTGIVLLLCFGIQAHKTKEDFEKELRANLYKCIAGDNQACENFIKASPEAYKKYRRLQRKQWVAHELQGKHLFQTFLRCKKTKKGNKKLVKKIMLHMVHNELVNKKMH